MSTENMAAQAAEVKAKYSEHDFVLLMDRSGSMQQASKRIDGATRWTEAEEFTMAFAGFAEQVDPDGIDVVLFGSSLNVFEGVTAAKVSEIYRSITPNGRTDLTSALQWAIDKQQRTGNKMAILVVTDGAPDNQASVQSAIIQATKHLSDNNLTRDYLSMTFVQVGDDRNASAFLDGLDDDLQSMGATMDIVDAINADTAEKMEIPALIEKMFND